MLQALITGTVRPVLIYKYIRPASIRSSVDWMWFRISTNICSDLIISRIFSMLYSACRNKKSSTG